MNILIAFHTPVKAGYAMKALERTFYDVALDLSESEHNVYFAYNEYSNEISESLPDSFLNIFEINRNKLVQKKYFKSLKDEISRLNIELALCFDLQVSGNLVKLLRQSGVKKIVSYWGATISSLNSGIKLYAKRLEVLLRRSKPDLFIFESEAMKKHAVRGRGIPSKIIRVVPTGVNTDTLKPTKNGREVILKEFSIPETRKVAIYSGHMEERKGVHVLINAMKSLIDIHSNYNWHLLICGNRPGEEKRFQDMLKGHSAEMLVTFCGYRDDLPRLMPACDLGLIASTGWDSFPMSALEMAACGLPLVVSDLQGLAETIEPNVTGLLFKPGNHHELAKIMDTLGSEESRLEKMSLAARERIAQNFTLDIQKKRLKQVLISVLSG